MDYAIIDIASLLKTFFRELPEQLIPPGNIQESLIRCLLCSDRERKTEVLLQTCLMLPTISLNTLSYFMQFLAKIAANSDTNKMSFSNLAVILTPGLMPVKDGSHQNRLSSHFKVLELLMENSAKIGIVPQRFLNQISSGHSSPATSNGLQKNPATPGIILSSLSIGSLADGKKKKRRRSTSLTKMFGGIKKLIQGAAPSTESLDKTSTEINVVTPCISKSTKKRKMSENMASFSTKKK